MNIALIGSGGREHVLCQKIYESKLSKNIICIPGNAGTSKIAQNINLDYLNFNSLLKIIKSNKINFVIVNGENAAKEGVGITENIVNELLSCGVDVITTGNHVWDQKETLEFIKKQKRLLLPLNL